MDLTNTGNKHLNSQHSMQKIIGRRGTNLEEASLQLKEKGKKSRDNEAHNVSPNLLLSIYLSAPPACEGLNDNLKKKKQSTKQTGPWLHYYFFVFCFHR